VLRRLFAPLTLVLTDEGLNGLSAHVVNDAAAPWRGSLQVTLLADGATPVETVRSSIEVAGRRTERFDLAALFPSFRDLTYAYRFGAPAHDVAHVELCSQGPAGSDRVVADAVHLPLGPGVTSSTTSGCERSPADWGKGSGCSTAPRSASPSGSASRCRASRPTTRGSISCPAGLATSRSSATAHGPVERSTP